jgi:protein Hikeshi
MSVFSVLFVGKTSAIPDAQGFKQVDPTHWLMDVGSLAGTAWQDLKEVALFLARPDALPPGAALALYVSVGNSTAWAFRGFLSQAHPSDVLPLSWPQPPEGAPPQPPPGYVQLGVALEPLEEATARQGAKLGAKEDFARNVGLDLFNYMQSFGGVHSVGSDKLLVPANVLDQWFARLSYKLRRDPDFLTRKSESDRV